MMSTTKFGALIAAVTIAAAGFTGCHSTGSRYDRSTGQYVDDKALAGNVRDALKDHPVYKLNEVEVTTFRGTVQLSGFVSTDEQRQRAAETAQDVPGVRSVENNISMKPGPLRQQEALRQQQQQDQRQPVREPQWQETTPPPGQEPVREPLREPMQE